MGPLVSVIIPCYNYGHYVGEAIDSALAQTYRPVEIIVVNDGSTDNTAEVLNSYANRRGVHYIQQQNCGLSAARNRGIGAAGGEFIALLDADDRWLPEKLESQISVFCDDQIGVVGADYVNFRDDGWRSNPVVGPEIEEVAKGLTHIFCRSNQILPSTAVIRKTVFPQVGYFDETLRSIEDYDMWLRISTRYRLAAVPEPLAELRLHGHNMSSQAITMFNCERTVLLHALERSPEIGFQVGKRGIADRFAILACLFAERCFNAADYKAPRAELLWQVVRRPFDLILVKFLLKSFMESNSVGRWLLTIRRGWKDQ